MVIGWWFTISLLVNKVGTNGEGIIWWVDKGGLKGRWKRGVGISIGESSTIRTWFEQFDAKILVTEEWNLYSGRLYGNKSSWKITC